MFFFFKQKTAYDLRISDWTSYVCSSALWMGAPDSFEARVVPQHGFAIDFIHVSGLRGKGVLKLLQAPLLIARAVREALAILKSRQPTAVLGFGGFAAGPGGLAAWLSGRPLLIHEQNAAAGLTNRCLARIARRVLPAFPNTFGHGETVGNPVRAGFAELPPPAQRLAHDGAARLLVNGGSPGSLALNQQIPQALALLPAARRPPIRPQAGRTLDIAQRSEEHP